MAKGKVKSKGKVKDTKWCRVPGCHRLSAEGTRTCAKHLDDARKRMARLRDRRASEDKCAVCEKPRVNSLYCEEHLQERREYDRERYHRQRDS